MSVRKENKATECFSAVSTDINKKLQFAAKQFAEYSYQCVYHHSQILPIHDKQFKACLLFSVNHLHKNFNTIITWLQSILKVCTICFCTVREMAYLLTPVCSEHNTEVSPNGFTGGKFTFQEHNPMIMTFWNDASITSSVRVVHRPGGKYD